MKPPADDADLVYLERLQITRLYQFGQRLKDAAALSRSVVDQVRGEPDIDLATGVSFHRFSLSHFEHLLVV